MAAKENDLSDGAPTPGQRSNRPSGDAVTASRARLRRLAAAAAWVLAWERTWPPLAWALTVVFVFLACSWLGLWFVVPPLGRAVGIALFAVALAAVLAPLVRHAVNRRRERDALARLDRDSGAPHRPASSSVDRLADPAADDATRALWRLHQRRLAQQIEKIALATPSPRMVDRDRFALRLGALALAIAAGFVAGPEKYARVAEAFDWRMDGAPAQGFRIDAWIDPPAFTGKPPIMLDALGKNSNGQPVKIETPAGSTLILRGDAEEVAAKIEGALIPVAPAGPSADKATAGAASHDSAGHDSKERRWTIKGSGKLTISRRGSQLSAFDIVGLANGKPVIALLGQPHPNARGSLTLRYRTVDQYGVAAAEADFAKPASGDKPPTRSLVEPPHMALQLPPTATGVGEAQTTSDLSDNAWAGAQVTMTLRADNIAGEEGKSEPVEITLPQRTFTEPLARALVEQRRDLALDPDHHRDHVAETLEALQIAPDLFGTSPSVYLGLNAAKTRLGAARSDEDLIGVCDLLWAMALQIEDGDASQAERDLRAAEQRLREALDRGASDEEIRQLMKDLRAAAQNFARELAEKAQKDNGANSEDSDEATLDAQDLQSLLDRMEETARSGDRAQAQAMLDQLQNLFENLHGARRGQMGQAEREMRRQMGALDKLLRDQQALRDKTFRRDQRERMRRSNPDWLGQNPSGSPDENNPQMNKDQGADNNPFGKGEGGDDQDADQTPLDQQQQALRDRLAELQRKLKGLGAKGEKGFDDADGAMGEAERDLKGDGAGKDGPPNARGRTGKGDAVEAQGRALQALREGAEGLQKQMQGQGQGQGQGESENDVEPGQGRQGRDPLGREFGTMGRGAAMGPLGNAIGAAERARRVMEELRRRLSDPSRPGEERDYLERLLNRDLPN
jgi:uncharacterized protein (TIGR02302 family)